MCDTQHHIHVVFFFSMLFLWSIYNHRSRVVIFFLFLRVTFSPLLGVKCKRQQLTLKETFAAVHFHSQSM